MACQFHPIDEAIWLPRLAAGCKELQAGKAGLLERRARAIIDALRNRHVALTTDLAATLALRLSNHPGHIKQPQSGSTLAEAMELWKNVWQRLERESSPPNTSSKNSDLLAVHPTFTIFKVVEPLLRVACEKVCQNITNRKVLEVKVPEVPLFADPGEDTEEYPHAHQEDILNEFEPELLTALKAIVASESDADLAWQPFWLDRGRALHNLHGKPATRKPAPETGALERAAIARLNTDPRDEPPPLLRRRSLARTEVANVAQMEGLCGIRLTRNPDDIGQVLFSELLYPDWLFIDRWLNSGYLIKQRYARRERFRDVLVTAFLPGSLRHAPVRAWLCSLWLDTMSRFTRAILRAGLARSELRWIEGDAFGRHRHLTRLVSGLTPGGAGEAAEARFAWGFHQGLRWLPEIMNAHADFAPLPVAMEAADPRAAVPRWLEAAWQAQLENPRWIEKSLREDAAVPMDVDEFAHCIGMFFLPASLGDEGKKESGKKPAPPVTEEALREQFTQSEDVPFQTIVTWVPERDFWLNPANWGVSSTIDGISRIEWLADEGEECTMMQLFTRLQERWLSLLLTEMSAT